MFLMQNCGWVLIQMDPRSLRIRIKNLEDYLKENPQFLGKHENEQLNFLFKILSVRRALSIQSHPTKDEAEKLHAKESEKLSRFQS